VHKAQRKINVESNMFKIENGDFKASNVQASVLNITSPNEPLLLSTVKTIPRKTGHKARDRKA